MVLSKIEKLQNFCNKLIIQRNNTGKGLCSYFEYRGNQYYASFIWDNCKGGDFAIFPALDKSVLSWTSLYRITEINLIDIKHFKECVFNYLNSLKPRGAEPHLNNHFN